MITIFLLFFRALSSDPNWHWIFLIVPICLCGSSHSALAMAMFFSNERHVNGGERSFLPFFFFCQIGKRKCFFSPWPQLTSWSLQALFFIIIFFSWPFSHPLCAIHRPFFKLWLTSWFTLLLICPLTAACPHLLHTPPSLRPKLAFWCLHVHIAMSLLPAPQRTAAESASLFSQMSVSSWDRQPMSVGIAGACGCSVTWRASRRSPFSFFVNLAIIYSCQPLTSDKAETRHCGVCVRARPFVRQQWFTMNTSALTWRTHAVTRVSAVCQEFKAAKAVWVQL